MNIRFMRTTVVLFGILSVPVALQSAEGPQNNREQNNYMNRSLNAGVRFGSGFFAHGLVNAITTGAIAKAADFQLQNLSKTQLLPLYQAVLISSMITGLFQIFYGSDNYKIEDYVGIGVRSSLVAVSLNINFMRCFLPLIR